jgi:hypothetical protein
MDYRKRHKGCSSTRKNGDNSEPEGFFVSIGPTATSRRIYQYANPERAYQVIF